MTATIERIKLENPGDELTLTVKSVTPEDIGGYSYWKISDGVKELVAPQKSINPQVERLGVASAPEMVGQTVKFSRSIKLTQHGKPYWNVDSVRTNSAPPKPPAVKTQLPQARSLGTPDFLPTEGEEQAELSKRIGFDRTKIEETLSLYQSIAEWGARELPKIFESGKNPVGITPETLAACVNTIFINTAGRK